LEKSVTEHTQKHHLFFFLLCGFFFFIPTYTMNKKLKRLFKSADKVAHQVSKLSEPELQKLDRQFKKLSGK